MVTALLLCLLAQTPTPHPRAPWSISGEPPAGSVVDGTVSTPCLWSASGTYAYRPISEFGCSSWSTLSASIAFRISPITDSVTVRPLLYFSDGTAHNALGVYAGHRQTGNTKVFVTHWTDNGPWMAQWRYTEKLWCINTPTNAATDEWVTFGFEVDGDGNRIYLNGALVESPYYSFGDATHNECLVDIGGLTTVYLGRGWFPGHTVVQNLPEGDIVILTHLDGSD